MTGWRFTRTNNSMNSSKNEHPFVVLLPRVAVPGLILLFYVTAVLRFDYTPDSTFTHLLEMRQAQVTSLWSALLGLASLLGLDTLLTAKIFSLAFSSFAILFTYLIAQEILEDRLAALSATLVVSMQAWLLQLGPSGSGAGAVLLLTLAAIFFLLRNDYLLAAIAAGLATLVSWQNVLLLPVLLLDVYVNSREPSHARKVMIGVLLVYVSVLLPWGLYMLYAARLVIPNEVALTSVPTVLPHLSLLMVLLVGLLFVGVALLASRERQLLRTHTALLLWIAVASFTHQVMFAISLPLVVVYGFFSIQHILLAFRRWSLSQMAYVLLAALILAYNQVVVLPATTKVMDDVAATSAELKSAALWLRNNTPEQETISVPDGYSPVVEFYSARPLGDAGARFLVTTQHDVLGYEVVFDPVEENPSLLTGSVRYKVWKRK